MKHPGPLVPKQPKLPVPGNRWWWPMLLTVSLAAAWLVLYLLMGARIIDQTTVLIVVILAVPAFTCLLTNMGWWRTITGELFGNQPPESRVGGGRRDVDIIRSIWPLESSESEDLARFIRPRPTSGGTRPTLDAKEHLRSPRDDRR